jgi:hypothetical protein
MICFSALQFPMMGTAEEVKELISKGTFKAFENRVYLAGACNELLTVMTDVGSCSNQFCLIVSTRICLVSHDITQ